MNLLLSLYIKLSQVRSMYKLLAVCVSLSLPLRLLLFLFIPDMRYDCARSYTSLPLTAGTHRTERRQCPASTWCSSSTGRRSPCRGPPTPARPLPPSQPQSSSSASENLICHVRVADAGPNSLAPEKTSLEGSLTFHLSPRILSHLALWDHISACTFRPFQFDS